MEKFFEQIMFKKIEAWVLGLLGILGVVGAVFMASVAVKTAQGDERFGALGDIAFGIATLPQEAKRLSRQIIRGELSELAAGEQRFDGQSGFQFDYARGAGINAGYILLSRYDGNRERSIVEFVDLNKQEVIHAWYPDFAAINARSKIKSEIANLSRDNTARRARVMHPLLTPNGELVFQNFAPLVKIDACGETIWSIDKLFHHSLEPHPTGGYLGSTFLEPQTIRKVSKYFKEDAIVHVSEEGEVLFEKSVPKILIENDMEHLIYGLDFYSDDPLHMNDVEYAPADGPHWQKGDLFLSLRNISAIVQYRPSTNAVVWIKQGPWVNQHDVDLLDDHRIAVFNNNRFNGRYGPYVHEANDVIIYNFATEEAEFPYQDALKELDVRTISEGRSQVMNNGDVIVEESNYGRLLRTSPDGAVVWSYVNRAADGRVFPLNWSRYVPAALGDAVVAQLDSLSCE